MGIYPSSKSQIHLFRGRIAKKGNYKIVASKADRIRQHLVMGCFFFLLIFLILCDRCVRGTGLFEVAQKQYI